jgi:hypothetical protein
MMLFSDAAAACDWQHLFLRYSSNLQLVWPELQQCDSIHEARDQIWVFAYFYT